MSTKASISVLSPSFLMSSSACTWFQVDRAAIVPSVAREMLATLQKLNESTFSPYRGPGEQNKDIGAACAAAVEKYGGFFGPFVDV